MTVKELNGREVSKQILAEVKDQVSQFEAEWKLSLIHI